jgi:hypothetical protein
MNDTAPSFSIMKNAECMCDRFVCDTLKLCKLIIEKNCPICQIKESLKPSHMGSKNCESGSLASGGNKSHCTCDICF